MDKKTYKIMLIKKKQTLRKFSNLVRIFFTFKNWLQISRNCLKSYFGYHLPANFAYLRKGPKLKIRFSTLFDVGSVIETYNRMVYFPSFLHIPSRPTIIDIGASVGDFSIYCATFFTDSKIFSYEPTEEAFTLFRENILLNKLVGYIHPHQMAVSGDQDSFKLPVPTLPFKFLSLKEVLEKNQIEKCDLLKMDCEGAEYDIFLNTKIEDLKKIDAITMECHLYYGYELLGQLKQHLIKAGFEIKTTPTSEHNICYLYARRTTRKTPCP